MVRGFVVRAQAAEKALKALLFERSGQLPLKTHDLRTLGSLVNATAAVQQDLAILFPVFGLTRYPEQLRGSASRCSESSRRGHLPRRSTKGTPVDTAAAVSANSRAAREFARRLRDELGVQHVYLFGSQATGRSGPDSDYDFLIVGEHFQAMPRLRRHFGLHELYWEAGGDAPLDLICLMPEEFESAKGRATLVRELLPEAIDLLAEETAPA